MVTTDITISIVIYTLKAMLCMTKSECNLFYMHSYIDILPNLTTPKYNLHTHIHTQRIIHNPNVNILLTLFFDFFFQYLSFSV